MFVDRLFKLQKRAARIILNVRVTQSPTLIFLEFLKKHYLLKFLPCDVLRKSNNMNGKNMNHQIHPVKR
jgi:hypothetical protein